MSLKLYYQLTFCGSLHDWRCLKKARLISQDISSLTQLRKSDAMSCSNRPATYKAFVITTTGTFNDARSMLEIWFFDDSKMILGYTSLTHDGKGLPLCTRSSPGSYRLQYPNGQEVSNSWIIEHLRRFHPWSTGTSSICAWRLILPVQLHFTESWQVLCTSLLTRPRSHTSSN
jgi:hypothetical protein